jgi:hypothetical protein
LRSRLEDIPVLVEHFLREHGAAEQAGGRRVTDAHVRHLQTYDWPGNIRELGNVVERAVILSGSGPLRFDEALPSSAFSYPARAALPEAGTPARGYLTATEFELVERNNLVGAMEATGWRVAGADGAAAQLGMPASRLRARLKALGIRKPAPTSLYARLGGNRGIATFARELFGRAIAHPTLGRFWRGRSTYGVLREERLLIAYLKGDVGSKGTCWRLGTWCARSKLGASKCVPRLPTREQEVPRRPVCRQAGGGATWLPGPVCRQAGRVLRRGG